MDLNTYFEKEALKNMLAHTMEYRLRMEPRDEILEPAADRMLILVHDVLDVLKDKEGKGDEELNSLIVFDALMQTIMTQDLLIQLQEEIIDGYRNS